MKTKEDLDLQKDHDCKAAVKNNGLYLQFVKNQTEEICKLAVKQDSCAMEFVENKFINRL